MEASSSLKRKKAERLVGEPFRDLGPFVRFGDGQTGVIAGHSDELRVPLFDRPHCRCVCVCVYYCRT
jgi:hypothetical protein